MSYNSFRCFTIPFIRDLPTFHLPENNFSMAGYIALGLVPINSLVPWIIVSGRSVLSRKVIHGIPTTDVPSVIPTESVTTTLARSTK